MGDELAGLLALVASCCSCVYAGYWWGRLVEQGLWHKAGHGARHDWRK